MSLIEEVSEWKLEAKLEDNDRYFFHVSAVDKLVSGKRLYVIGRKGTGKTAICEYLVSRKDPDYFSRKLTFKNFPFNDLYEMRDEGYTAPNRYITLWKYLIYVNVCRMLADNPKVDLETRDQLRAHFSFEVEEVLSNAVKRWVGVNFDIKILGSGIGGGAKKDEGSAGMSLSERVSSLEAFLKRVIGEARYIVVFDELDEDYKDIIVPENFDKYTELLTGLFKAVQDIRSSFIKYKLYPIVFLRDDIYDLLQDPDKTKWSDFRIDLEWDASSIKSLLAFRLSRAVDPCGPILPFDRAWQLLFLKNPVAYGHKQQDTMPIFDYMMRSSHLRPRDFIKYIQVCASNAFSKGLRKVSPKIVRAEDKTFSNYLRSELEDEIHGAVPEIKQIFNLLSVIRRQTFSVEDFKIAYADAVQNGKIPQRDPSFVLEVLFVFSVIGNQPRQRNYQVFRYKNKEARFNFSERIIVHRGLFKSLQIL